MKVSESNRTSSGDLTAVRNAAAAITGTAGAGISGSRSDDVQISTLMKVLTSMPETRGPKITELSNAVSSGRYHVDAALVSDKLIQEHLAA